jgi:hemerythrin-like domain-containing protein
MSYFHEQFKKDFNTLHDLSDGPFEGQGLSLQGYLQLAKTFDQQVTLHHTLEERILFPLLAEYMPQFGKGDGSGNHFELHHTIHEGLGKLQKLTDNWLESPLRYSSSEMKECLNGFRDVLFQHLDEEVREILCDWGYPLGGI